MASPEPRSWGVDPNHRWSQMRLLVQRGATGTGYASLILRTGQGPDVWDRRLAEVQFDCSPGSQASRDVITAMRVVLDELERKRDSAQRSASP